MLVEAGRELAQDAVHFAQLFFAQPDQFVVQFDRFKRLDEERVAATARTVDYAFHAPLAARHDRHNEPVVANSYEVFLQRPVLLVRAQEPLERLLNQVTLLFYVAAETGQGYARVIGHAAIRQDLATQIVNQVTEISEPGGVRG